MPYVNSDGTISDNRSSFRLSIISDFFWGIINTVGLFFSTLLNPTATLPPARKPSNSTYTRLGGDTSGSGKNQGAPAPRKFGATMKTLPKNCNTGR